MGRIIRKMTMMMVFAVITLVGTCCILCENVYAEGSNPYGISETPMGSLYESASGDISCAVDKSSSVTIGQLLSEWIVFEKPKANSNYKVSDAIALDLWVADYYDGNNTTAVFVHEYLNGKRVSTPGGNIIGIIENNSFSRFFSSDMKITSPGKVTLVIELIPVNVKTGEIDTSIPVSSRKTRSISFYVYADKTPTSSFASTSVTKKTTDAPFTNKYTTNSDGKVTYKSSNSAVATIDSAGKVTIKGAGKTTITASTARSYKYAAQSKTYVLTVNTAAPGISFKYQRITFNTEDAGKRYSNPAITNSDGAVTYSSSDTSVISVNQNGIISPKGKFGSAKITATCAETAKYKAATYSYNIWVKYKPIAYFKDATLTKYVTDGVFNNTLTTTTDGTGTFTSSNTSVATVSTDGKVTIKGAGTTTVSVSYAETDKYQAIKTSYTLKVIKLTPNVKVSGASKAVKYKSVKKKSTYTTAVAVSGAKGTKSFYKVGGSSKLTISKTTGKIKVKKGTRKGTYSIKVKVISAATRNYYAKTSAVKTIKVKVK